jgi:hypothetical protein
MYSNVIRGIGRHQNRSAICKGMSSKAFGNSLAVRLKAKKCSEKVRENRKSTLNGSDEREL